MERPTKASLRTELRKVLAAITTDMRIAASAEICRQIEALPEWAAARTVAFYAAQPSEPDLAPLLDVPGKAACFPRVSGDALEFHHCDSNDLLRSGPWKLLEPDPERFPAVRASEIDLLFIPGLAYTRAGARLGRGGGFYDRFLGRTHPSAVKLGVCFHAQLVFSLPLEIHDRAVDQVITEENVFRCGQ